MAPDAAPQPWSASPPGTSSEANVPLGCTASCSLALVVRDGEIKRDTGPRIAAHFERVDRGPFLKSGYWLLAFVLFELHTMWY